MGNPTSQNIRPSSNSSKKLFLGFFSSKSKGDRATHQPQADEQPVNATYEDPSSHATAEDQLTTPLSSISRQTVDLTGNDSPGEKGTDLKGLWREAYEQLKCGPNPAKLIKAHQLAFLEDDGVNRDAEQEYFDINPRLHSVVERKFRDIPNSRTRVHRGGKEIIVQDQVDRIVKVLISVQGLVTTAVGSEPHAALAWAGALVLLAGPITRSLT